MWGCFRVGLALLRSSESWSSLFFFFLMIRRPPRSTLFPSRRSSDLRRRRDLAGGRHAEYHLELLLPGFALRSEEHTSELQSLAYLVCRLLLEKKNTHHPHTDLAHILPPTRRRPQPLLPSQH